MQPRIGRVRIASWVVAADDLVVLARVDPLFELGDAQHVEGVRGFAGIRQLSMGHEFEANICDWDAEDRATFENLMGVETIAADKRISTGIEAVQNRLKVQGDGKPKIFYFRNALVEEDPELKLKYKPTQTIDEFASYVWRGLDNKREQTSRDEKPIKTDDHGMDTTKYMCAYLDCQAQYGKPGWVAYA